MDRSLHELTRRPRVLILGAGFAGLRAARRLMNQPVDVLVVDKHNYHTFLPLLYQVASAGLEPEAIGKPVRSILRKADNTRFRMAEVTGIDLERRCVATEAGDLGYDYLIVAAGSATNYFGSEEIERNALALKELVDASVFRSHVLSMFETAVLTEDLAKRRKLMTTVIVGGGPTGVELAGALAELRRHVLPRDYPELDLSQAEVVLIEATDALLPGFPARLQRKALHQLRAMGVEVRLGTPVETVEEGLVRLEDGATLDAATITWVAGVRASLLSEGLVEELARGRRVPVATTLQVPDHPEVYVAGDMAYIEQDGKPVPMVAPAAIQMGEYAAENILRQVEGRPLKDFRYKDRGSLATIGRKRAVASVPPLQFTGVLAWVVWLVVHLFWLIGFRNRVMVLVSWAWNYLLYEPGSRLITRQLRHQGRAAREEVVGPRIAKP